MEKPVSRSSLKPIAVLVLVFVLLSISATSISANFIQPYAAAGYESGGTWSNRLSRDDFPKYHKIQQPNLQVVEPVNDLVYDLVVDQAVNKVVDQAIDRTALALTQFASKVQTGIENQVTGVFVNDVLAYPVVQQPSGSAAFVSSQTDVVTQFSLAAQYGTIGILAHNFLAGVSFFNLLSGQDVYVVFGDGSTAHYVITDVRRFQALDPYSPYSSFIDLDTNAKYTSSEVFYEVYGNEDKLVLQTCIAAEGIDSWGRLFVIAEKIS